MMEPKDYLCIVLSFTHFFFFFLSLLKLKPKHNPSYTNCKIKKQTTSHVCNIHRISNRMNYNISSILSISYLDYSLFHIGLKSFSWFTLLIALKTDTIFCPPNQPYQHINHTFIDSFCSFYISCHDFFNFSLSYFSFSLITKSLISSRFLETLSLVNQFVKLFIGNVKLKIGSCEKMNEQLKTSMLLLSNTKM